MELKTLTSEWAARWEDTSEATLDSLATPLGLRLADLKRESFKVSFAYAEVAATPPGYRWIVRRRHQLETGKNELTLKLRGNGPLDTWTPPLDGKESREIDVSLIAGGELVRSVSFSVTAKSKRDDPPPELPGGWHIGDWFGEFTMNRLKAADSEATIEHWNIRNRWYFEISRRAEPGQDIAFPAWVRRAVAGVTLLDTGMTTIATTP